MKIEIRNELVGTTTLTLAEQDLVLHRDFVRSPRREFAETIRAFRP